MKIPKFTAEESLTAPRYNYLQRPKTGLMQSDSIIGRNINHSSEPTINQTAICKKLKAKCCYVTANRRCCVAEDKPCLEQYCITTNCWEP